MNTKELRIGNIIYGAYDNGDNCGKEECEILCIDGTGGNIAEHSIWVDSKSNNEIFNDFTPIPLTENALVRLGCVEQIINSKQKNYWNKEKDFSVDVAFGVEENLFYYRIHQDRVKHIMYVHQLQNLHFALKNEELVYAPK